MPGAAATDDLHCLACGYSLRGIDSERCPECGAAIDREALAVPQIPWANRKATGSFRAYWRTVWLVLWRPARAAADVNRSVSYQDARRFQHITVMLAFIPLACSAIWGAWDTELFHVHGFSNGPLGWTLELGVIPVGLMSMWLFLFAATGAPSYFFHPRSLPPERQNRAIALSYYASAPLALTPILIAFAACIGALYGTTFRSGFLDEGVLIALVQALFILMVFSLWRAPLTFLSRCTGCSRSRLWAFALYLPISWTLLGAFFLAGIPAAYVFVSVVILSLR